MGGIDSKSCAGIQKVVCGGGGGDAKKDGKK